MCQTWLEPKLLVFSRTGSFRIEGNAQGTADIKTEPKFCKDTDQLLRNCTVDQCLSHLYKFHRYDLRETLYCLEHQRGPRFDPYTRHCVVFLNETKLPIIVLNTIEASASSQRDWRLVDWEVKPEYKQILGCLCSPVCVRPAQKPKKKDFLYTP